jgi:hypothetical protein
MAETWRAWAFRDGERDAESLVGWTVEAKDGNVGTIDDATVDAGQGALVVGTGRVFRGHMTLLPAGTVERVDADHRRVNVAFTRAQIAGAPRRRTGIHFDDDAYREEVAAYYGALSGG